MEKKYQILIVDDTEINRSLLADMLSPQYEVLEAANGVEAIALLGRHHAGLSLVLLDIIMPAMDGFEVLDLMRKSEHFSHIPVITISAETSSAYIDRAYDLGATDYISRPFDEKTVQRRVKNTIMLYAKQKKLEDMVTEQILEKEKNNFLMVEILSNIVEFRNGESGLHVLHIRTVTELLLRQLVCTSGRYPLTTAQIALIVNASALHDIGKISIPEAILNKAGKLTPEEFEVIKAHSVIGAQILENAPCQQQEELVRVAHDICRWHHERYDGRGYPDGLAGDDIPISAQVVALADVYDALTNARVYKPAYSHETAMRMILDGECGAFNPLLLQCLIEIGPQIASKLDHYSPDEISKSESRYLTNELLRVGHASSRTLALLEQERIKYQFFASMSKEIQFEYNERTDLLTLSEWGAAQLGISELIVHPADNAELSKVFRPEDFIDLHTRLRSVTPANPVVNAVYSLQVYGKPRWYKVVGRPLWVEEDQPVITGTIGKFLDIHEEYMELDNFRRMAVQDSLTKLRNHMAARQVIESALTQKAGCHFAMLLFDLDFFKEANDQFGHLFGDEVLKHVAQKMLQNIRSTDVAARVGGDEFLIFISYSEDVESMVQRIFDALTGDFAGFPISVSLGVALYPAHGQDYETLFHCADQALYAAKKAGRRQYCYYDSSVQGYLSVLSPMDCDWGDPSEADGCSERRASALQLGKG